MRHPARSDLSQVERTPQKKVLEQVLSHWFLWTAQTIFFLPISGQRVKGSGMWPLSFVMTKYVPATATPMWHIWDNTTPNEIADGPDGKSSFRETDGLNFIYSKCILNHTEGLFRVPMYCILSRCVKCKSGCSLWNLKEIISYFYAKEEDCTCSWHYLTRLIVPIHSACFEVKSICSVPYGPSGISIGPGTCDGNTAWISSAVLAWHHKRLLYFALKCFLK